MIQKLFGGYERGLKSIKKYLYYIHIFTINLVTFCVTCNNEGTFNTLCALN